MRTVLLSIVATVLVCFVLPLFPSSSTASLPNLTGTWVGVMTQPGGPYAEYFLKVEIAQRGPQIVGKSRIEIPETSWYGEMPIEGEYRLDSLRYKEGWMVSENIPSEIAWCLKQVTLTLIPAADSLGLDSLIGRWEAPPCLPGEIRLARKSVSTSLTDSLGTVERFAPDSLSMKGPSDD